MKVRGMRWIWLMMSGVVASVEAFPPAPYYTLYGIVRDQVGQTLTAQGAVLELLRGGDAVMRTPVESGVWLEQNYAMRIRIDADLGGTRLYDEAALAAGEVYSLRVEINGEYFYPIEVAGTLRAGSGGERVRLDLNLGADSDGDGLPDTWEAWQLYQAGYNPDSTGAWPLAMIDRTGDFDGDGRSNYLEYLAGTFAGDAAERFELRINERNASQVALEFYGITGKVYTVEHSADMTNWAVVAVAPTRLGAAAEWLTATAVGIVEVYAQAPPGDNPGFYRLTVR